MLAYFNIVDLVAQAGSSSSPGLEAACRRLEKRHLDYGCCVVRLQYPSTRIGFRCTIHLIFCENEPAVLEAEPYLLHLECLP